MNIVNVGYDSTNYYVLEQNNVRLLVDVGMPGSLPKLLANLKRKDLALQAIDYPLFCRDLKYNSNVFPHIATVHHHNQTSRKISSH